MSSEELFSLLEDAITSLWDSSIAKIGDVIRRDASVVVAGEAAAVRSIAPIYKGNAAYAVLLVPRDHLVGAIEDRYPSIVENIPRDHDPKRFSVLMCSSSCLVLFEMNAMVMVKGGSA